VIKPRSQVGFTLVTAIFLLVVVASLSVFMLNFRNVQQSTLVYGVQGARAMSAARTGLEWGIYQTITLSNVNSVCASGTPITNSFSTSGAGSLDTFNITVVCQFSDHIEGVSLIRTYQLTSSAQVGTFGTLDYVYRSLQASVSKQPP